jgi:four helix bundle protein
MTQNFKEVFAWQKAHEFVVMVYETTKQYPSFERFGLCSQFQRAAVSIPANIAEGYRRDGMNDKLRFLNIAQGSLEECRYYILLSKDLQYISIETYDSMNSAIEETSRLLNAYYKSIKSRNIL